MDDNLYQRLLSYPKLFRSDGQMNPNSFNIFKSSKLFKELINDMPFLSSASIPQIVWHVSNNINLPVTCKICENRTKFISKSKGYAIYCSSKCANNDVDKKNKSINACQNRYGVDNYSQSSEFKLKFAETMNHRYGKSHALQVPELLQKTKDTKLSRYGNEHFNNPIKARNTSIKKYGNFHKKQTHFSAEAKKILFSKSNFTKYSKNKSAGEIALFLDVDYTTITKYANIYEIQLKISSSKFEDIIDDFFKTTGIHYVKNIRKIIPPLELDFYLPDYNIAIEINGNYWHSEIGGKKDRNYHYNKWLRCREKGIDLYSYFDDELINNIDIIKSKLKYIISQTTRIVGARKMQIGKVGFKEESIFLKKYHIQGPSNARNKTIGAYYNNELVAVFSWLKRKQYLEITRYACDSKASYPGLFSKMMKYMIKELDYHGKIVSFSNNGHSNGGVYKASGFTINKILSGAYWYTKDYYIRENRQNYMKDDIIKKFNDPQFRTDNKSEWTEWQAMQSLGYDRIWDSGKIKWEKIV